MNVLLLGCGHSRQRRLMLRNYPNGSAQLVPADNYGEWPDGTQLMTWDTNPECLPSSVIDLDRSWPLWFDDHSNRHRVDIDSLEHHFDEIHAYEVLEHLGTQGDVLSFFNTFVGIWMLLKKGGVLFATVPHWKSEWAWGDPSHRRVITPGSLSFLSKRQYREQLGKTPMSDFREYLGGADFEVIQVVATAREDILYFALRAV